MSYKSAITEAQGNHTIPSESSSTSKIISPNPIIPPKPLSLDYSQNATLCLTITQVNGHNYLEWDQSIKLDIDGKGKMEHLPNERPKLEVGDPNKKMVV